MMPSAPESWWLKVHGPMLAQGDYLPDCFVPVFNPEYGRANSDPEDVPVDDRDCIVVTQSCDLENDKANFVALCPLYPILEFEQSNSRFKEKRAWERVRQGRVEGLHLIASMQDPNDNWACLVADFREIYSLPIAYLRDHASSLEHRWRLRSPYLEHFSQAFARFFMRVGLPSSITPFK
jgi:hypothetical protein